MKGGSEKKYIFFFYFLIEDEWITAAFSLKIAIFFKSAFLGKKAKKLRCYGRRIRGT